MRALAGALFSSRSVSRHCYFTVTQLIDCLVPFSRAEVHMEMILTQWAAIIQIFIVWTFLTAICWQAKILYNDGFTKEEKANFKSLIQTNIYKYMSILLEGRERFEEEEDDLAEIRAQSAGQNIFHLECFIALVAIMMSRRKLKYHCGPAHNF